MPSEFFLFKTFFNLKNAKERIIWFQKSGNLNFNFKLFHLMTTKQLIEQIKIKEIISGGRIRC
jgi:hypothetical protein